MDSRRRWSLALALAPLWLGGCGLLLDLDPPDPDVRLDGGGMDGGRRDGGSRDGGSTDGGQTDGGPTDGGQTAPECELDVDCGVEEACRGARCDEGRCVQVARVAQGCDDGVFCNGLDRCGADGECSVHGGDPCPGASVCDEDAARCTGCASDADCPGAEAGEWGPCQAVEGAPVCALSGVQTRVVVGAQSCGPGGVCDRASRLESRACSLPDGASCGVDVVELGECEATSPCAGERDVSRQRFTCTAGRCDSSRTTRRESCSLPEGRSCGEAECSACTFIGACDLAGNQICRAQRCMDGSCRTTTIPVTRRCRRGVTELAMACLCDPGPSPGSDDVCVVICGGAVTCPGGGLCGCRADGTCGCPLPVPGME